MDNKLRIKRVKEGIKLLEKRQRPANRSESWSRNKAYFGVSERGWYLLSCNGALGDKYELEENGFKYGISLDFDTMLHNWKRFLELIENIK